MRSRNSLTRLAAAAPIVEVRADDVEEDRILARILASERSGPARRRRVTRRATLILVGVAVLVAAAALAMLEIGRGTTQAKGTVPRHHVVLTGPRIELAGFHFRLPAGFKASSDSCVAASSSSGPVTVMNGFAAAASAEGGCVEAFFMVSSPDGRSPAGNGAQPVDVGTYQGYFVPADASGESTLYVQLPTLYNGSKQYLALFSEGLTEAQLIAVAQSGLPGNG